MNKTDKIIHNELVSFVKICGWSLEKESINSIARNSNLSWITVYNLLTGKTKYPRYHTIQKLGMVAGLKLEFNGPKAKIKVRKRR